MTNPPNPKVFLGLTILSLAAGAGACYWQFGVMQQQNTELSKLQRQIKDEGKLQDELTLVQKQVQTSSEKLQHLEGGLPNSAYVPTLLLELEDIGKKNGITVSGVRPKDQSKKKPTEKEKEKNKAYVDLIIEVNGSGTYDAVMNFVKSLEAFPKIIAIRSLALTPAKVKTAEHEAGGPTVLDMSLELKAFLFSDDSAGTQARKEGESSNES